MSENYWLAFAVVFFLSVIDFIFFFGFKALVKVSILDDALILHSIKYMFVKVEDKVLFKDLEYSYEYETGTKGILLEELRFYRHGRKIIGIGRGYDGWKKEVVSQIINDFEILEIKYFKK